MKQSDFDLYKTTNGEASVYKGIPIQLLEEFKKAFNNHTFRVRYRGPRMATIGQDGRWPSQCQRDCLKKRAEYFSVYDLREKPMKNNDLERENDALRGEIQQMSFEISFFQLTHLAARDIIEEKDIQINDLEEQLGRASYVNEDLQLEINDLQDQYNDVLMQLELANQKLREIKSLASEQF